MSKYTFKALENLASLVKIESVASAPAPLAPFGVNIRLALDYALALAKELGFTVEDVDGYAGYADWNVGAAETVGVLSHLDVVPLGSGWQHAQGETVHGVLYGRGVADDKGGFISTLYALVQLRDSGFCPERNVRLIFGCDEESGSRCMRYFAEHVGMPTLGFSPDSDFPLIRFEKTILHLDVSLSLPATILSWVAGQRANMVADLSCVTTNIAIDGATKTDDHTFQRIDTGRAAHAMNPELGDSAIWHTASSLRIAPTEPLARLVALCNANACELLGIACTDDTGTQTLNIGMLETIDKTLRVTLDLRCPRTQDVESVISKLELHFGAKINVRYHSPYLLVDTDSELFQKLYHVWTARTHSDLLPKMSGGGTYARSMPNCVAFGPYLPDIDNRIHDSDEFLSVPHLDFLIDIYADALRALCTLPT